MDFDLKKEFSDTVSGLAKLKKPELILPILISSVLGILLLPGYLITVSGWFEGGFPGEKKLFDKDTEPVETSAWVIHLIVWSVLTVAIFYGFAKGDEKQLKENLRIAFGFIVIGGAFTWGFRQADIKFKEDKDICGWVNIVASLLFTIGYVFVDKTVLIKFFNQESKKSDNLTSIVPPSPTNSFASVPIATLM